MKIYDILTDFFLFNHRVESKDKDKQQIALITNIIGQLFEFYMVNGISNSVSLVDGKNKTIIDLFCLLPEDFCNVGYVYIRSKCANLFKTYPLFRNLHKNDCFF